MQNDTEFLERMHQRSAELEAQAAHRRARFSQIITAVSGIAAVIVLALMVPDVLLAPDSQPIFMQASIFAENSMLSYIVTGILAFMLGIGVTLLCFKLKQYYEDKNKQHDRED